MEIIGSLATHRQPPSALRQLGKSLLLPLLAIGFIGLSFVALFFVDAGTTQFSLWVSDPDGELQQRVDTSRLGAPLVVRPEGTEGSPAPPGCAGRGRQVVLESNEPSAGEALLAELAARNVLPCGGLSFKTNVLPSDASALNRQLVGWPQFLVLLCGAIAVSRIYKTYGAARPEAAAHPRHALNIFIGVLGAIAVEACTWLISFAFPAAAPSLPAAEMASGLPLVFTVSVSLVVPLIEETAFRAWLIPIAGKVLGAGGAIAFSSVIFAFFHGTLDLPHLAFYAAAGLVLSLVWLRTRSLLACVVAHAAHNSWVSLQYFLV